MTTTPMPGTTAKPMAKYADAVSGTYTARPTAPTRERPTFGFGSRAASKSWSPPETARPPKDWWKRS